jgi:hypothetical protein
VAPEIEVDRIEIRGTRGPRYRLVTSDPLSREMVIQVLTCYAAEMWWSPIIHEPPAYSQREGNIIKHIMQDVLRQSFQKFPVREYPGKVCDIGFETPCIYIKIYCTEFNGNYM